jgi:hypothetical protein
MWERYPLQMAEALRRHDMLPEVMFRCGGCVFKTAGDASSVAFDVASIALEAAVEAQRRHQIEPRRVEERYKDAVRHLMSDLQRCQRTRLLFFGSDILTRRGETANAMGSDRAGARRLGAAPVTPESVLATEKQIPVWSPQGEAVGMEMAATQARAAIGEAASDVLEGRGLGWDAACELAHRFHKGSSTTLEHCP